MSSTTVQLTNKINWTIVQTNERTNERSIEGTNQKKGHSQCNTNAGFHFRQWKKTETIDYEWGLQKSCKNRTEFDRKYKHREKQRQIRKKRSENQKQKNNTENIDHMSLCRFDSIELLNQHQCVIKSDKTGQMVQSNRILSIWHCFYL